MSTVQWFMLIALPVLGVLTWFLWREHATDLIQQLNERRRLSSRLVGRGSFIDGPRHIPVALALSDSEFYYENRDMQASLELKWIHEVEYEDELSTGQGIEDGKVLRLRCFSQTFEFVLAGNSANRWKTFLPAHRMGEQQPVGDARVQGRLRNLS